MSDLRTLSLFTVAGILYTAVDCPSSDADSHAHERRRLAPLAEPVLRDVLAALLDATLLIPPASAHAAAAKHVLIVRGESPDLPGGRAIVDAIEAGLRASLVSPVDLYIETIDTGRFSGRAVRAPAGRPVRGEVRRRAVSISSSRFGTGGAVRAARARAVSGRAAAARADRSPRHPSGHAAAGQSASSTSRSARSKPSARASGADHRPAGRSSSAARRASIAAGCGSCARIWLRSRPTCRSSTTPNRRSTIWRAGRRRCRGHRAALRLDDARRRRHADPAGARARDAARLRRRSHLRHRQHLSGSRHCRRQPAGFRSSRRGSGAAGGPPAGRRPAGAADHAGAHRGGLARIAAPRHRGVGAAAVGRD